MNDGPRAPAWELTAATTRKLFNEMMKMHESAAIPGWDDFQSIEVAQIVWPYCNQIFRFARSAQKLADSQLGTEAQVLIRICLEYLVVGNYVASLGDEGAHMWLDTQRVVADRTINESLASIPLDDEFRQEVLDEAKLAGAEKQPTDSFVKVCQELGLMDIYAWYGTSSALVHPTTMARNLYIDGEELRRTPRIDFPPSRVFEQLIIVLLWTASLADALLLRPTRTARLREIAQTIKRPATLPSARPVAGPRTKRPKRTRGWEPPSPPSS